MQSQGWQRENSRKLSETSPRRPQKYKKYKNNHVEFKWSLLHGKVPNVSTWCYKWSHFVLDVFLGFVASGFPEAYHIRRPIGPKKVWAPRRPAAGTR